jgi:hypothetical protein
MKRWMSPFQLYYGRDGMSEPARPGQIEAALKCFTDSLPHLEIYLENTPVNQTFDHDSDARLMLYWRVIHMWLAASATQDQRFVDADAAGRQVLWRVLRYKSEHKIEDCSAEVLADYLEPIEFYRKLPSNQRDRIYKEDLDLRLGLLKQFAYRHDTEELCRYLLWIDGGLPEADWLALRAKIAAIGSPAILAEEDKLRAEGVAMARTRQEEAAERAREDAEPPPVIDHPEITFTPLALVRNANAPAPIPVSDCIGCIPAGQDADFFWSASETYFMYTAKPGLLLRATGPYANVPKGYPFVDPKNPLKQRLSASGVCFDGRLVWYIVELEEVHTVLSDGKYYKVTKPVGWTVNAIDVKARVGYMLTRSQGLPPSPNAIVPLAPGKVCVSGWFWRAWCAVASIDLDESQVPNSIKVIYEGRDLPRGEWDRDPSPSIAYAFQYMTVLSSVVSSAQDSATTQPALPKVLARRGPGFLVIDPNIGSVSPLADPFSDRQTGSSATLVVGDNVYWQGQIGKTGGGELRRSTLDRLTPTAPAIELSPGPLYSYNGMLHHIDPAKHEWSVSSDGIQPFRPLRGCVPDSPAAPGTLTESRVYGLLLMDSGKDHATYQVKFFHDPSTQPATRP